MQPNIPLSAGLHLQGWDGGDPEISSGRNRVLLSIPADVSADSQSITGHRPLTHTGDQFEVSSESNMHVIRPVAINANLCKVRLLLKVFTSEVVAMETLALSITEERVKFGFLSFFVKALSISSRYVHAFNEREVT